MGIRYTLVSKEDLIMNLVDSVRNFIFVSHFKVFRIILGVFIFGICMLFSPLLILLSFHCTFLLEWIVAQSLLIERIFPWNPDWTKITTLYLIMGIVCFLPTICIWLLYIKKQKYIFYIFAALLLNMLIINLHYQHCKQSVHSLLLGIPKKIPIETLFRECGAPLYYGDNTDQGINAFYSDGNYIRLVFIYKNGTCFITGFAKGHGWLD